MGNPVGRPKKEKNHPGECKLAGCSEVSLGSRYSRLCEAHYAIANNERGTCEHKGCKDPRCLPYADGYCEKHHPGKQALTSHEKTMMDRALAGASIKAIAAEVGISPSAVGAKLSSPTMRAVVEAASIKSGLTTEHIMQTLKDATAAEKVMIARDPDGDPIPVEIGPDWDMRLRASELGAKVLGMMAPTKTETDVQTQHQVLVVLPAKAAVPLNHPVKIIEVRTAEESQ